jgi:hypothetical protein
MEVHMSNFEEREFNALSSEALKELATLQEARNLRESLYQKVRGLKCSNTDCNNTINNKEGWDAAIMKGPGEIEFGVVACCSACKTAIRLRQRVRIYANLVEHLKPKR